MTAFSPNKRDIGILGSIKPSEGGPYGYSGGLGKGFLDRTSRSDLDSLPGLQRTMGAEGRTGA